MDFLASTQLLYPLVLQLVVVVPVTFQADTLQKKKRTIMIQLIRRKLVHNFYGKGFAKTIVGNNTLITKKNTDETLDMTTKIFTVSLIKLVRSQNEAG